MKLLLLLQVLLQVLLMLVREGRKRMGVMMMGRPEKSPRFSAGIKDRTIVSISEPISGEGGATTVVMVKTASPRRRGKQRRW